jgi:hypothetical protein
MCIHAAGFVVKLTMKSMIVSDLLILLDWIIDVARGFIIYTEVEEVFQEESF